MKKTLLAFIGAGILMSCDESALERKIKNAEERLDSYKKRTKDCQEDVEFVNETLSHKQKLVNEYEEVVGDYQEIITTNLLYVHSLKEKNLSLEEKNALLEEIIALLEEKNALLSQENEDLLEDNKAYKDTVSLQGTLVEQLDDVVNMQEVIFKKSLEKKETVILFQDSIIRVLSGDLSTMLTENKFEDFTNQNKKRLQEKYQY